MFTWFTGCTGSSSCPFQRALNNITYADWSVPSDSSLLYVIQCFQGKHNDVIRSQKAFLKFKTKFEQYQDKNNSAFRLKNLLLLDRCTEELIILDIIAHYEYNRLAYDHNKKQGQIESKLSQNLGQNLQQFIYSYYLYLKKKADIYQKMPNELFDMKSRKSYINNAQNLNRIFEFIDFVLQIQKLLNQANENLKKVNRTADLIQQILTYLLKTYIFCYSIVAICLQTLLSKVKLLKFSDLTNLDKLLKYFSKDFTNLFVKFLESNKNIQIFKNFQYNEIIRIDPTFMQIFDSFYRIKAQQKNTPSTFSESPKKKGSFESETTTSFSQQRNVLDFDEAMEASVQQLPNQVYSKLTQQLKFSYIRRNKYQKVISSDEHVWSACFTDYKNYYSQNFIEDQKSKQSKSPQTQQPFDEEIKLNKKKSNILSKKSVMQQLVNVKFKRKGSRQSTIRQNKSQNNFKQAIWITWQNLYSKQIEE